jgi:hypothetical protein
MTQDFHNWYLHVTLFIIINMDQKELRLLYKRQTGRSPFGGDHYLNNDDIQLSGRDELEDYVEWLESVAINNIKPTIVGNGLITTPNNEK